MANPYQTPQNTEDNIGNTHKKLNRAALYEKIKEISPCSIYKLAKEFDENYKTIWYAIRDMEFAGIIYVHVEIVNGRESKIITIPKMEEKEESEE